MMICWRNRRRGSLGVYSTGMTRIDLGEDAPPPLGGYRPAVDALAFSPPGPLLRRLYGGALLVVALVALVSQLDVWAPLSFVGRQPHRPVLSLVFFAGSDRKSVV